MAEHGSSPVLEINGLKTQYTMAEGIVRAVDGVDLRVNAGETLCVVGESGCGKSVTARSILQLVDAPGRIVDGEILFRPSDRRPRPAPRRGGRRGRRPTGRAARRRRRHRPARSARARRSGRSAARRSR